MAKLKISSVLRARCPACHEGKVTHGVWGIRPRCPNQKCGQSFYPESGFYLGAMMVGFFATAFFTIPPMIALKIAGVDRAILMIFPFIEFLFVGTFLLYYSRIFWLHLEYNLSHRLDPPNQR